MPEDTPDYPIVYESHTLTRGDLEASGAPPALILQMFGALTRYDTPICGDLNGIFVCNQVHGHEGDHLELNYESGGWVGWSRVENPPEYLTTNYVTASIDIEGLMPVNTAVNEADDETEMSLSEMVEAPTLKEVKESLPPAKSREELPPIIDLFEERID